MDEVEDVGCPQCPRMVPWNGEKGLPEILRIQGVKCIVECQGGLRKIWQAIPCKWWSLWASHSQS